MLALYSTLLYALLASYFPVLCLQDEDVHLERLRIREEHAEKKRKEVCS